MGTPTEGGFVCPTVRVGRIYGRRPSLRASGRLPSVEVRRDRDCSVRSEGHETPVTGVDRT